MQTKRLLAYSAIYLLWGGSYVAIRCVVVAIPPLLAAGIRYSVAGLILLAISSVRRSSVPTRIELRNAALTGIMSLGVAFGAVFWAETRLPSWIVGVLLTTSFLWTYLGECLLRRRRPAPKTLIAILLGLAAVPLILKPEFHRASGSALAIIAVLAAAWMWSASVLIIRCVPLPVDSLQRSSSQLTAAGLFLIASAFLTHQTHPLATLVRAFSWSVALSMAYLVLAASLLAFTAFQWLVEHEEPHLVATSSYVNPVVALLAGVCLLGEQCTPLQLAGATILLASVCAVWRFHMTAKELPVLFLAEAMESPGRACLDRPSATAAR